MSKKKTKEQRENVNGKDKAKNKHKTLATEVIKNLDAEQKMIIGDDGDYFGYPKMLLVNDGTESTELIMQDARENYDTYINSRFMMSILFQPQDKKQVATLALLMVAHEKVILEGVIEPMITETNGNTFKEMRRENPAVGTALRIGTEISKILKNLGQLPSARADILQKIATLKDDKVIDNKDSERKSIRSLGNYLGKHKQQ